MVAPMELIDRLDTAHDSAIKAKATASQWAPYLTALADYAIDLRDRGTVAHTALTTAIDDATAPLLAIAPSTWLEADVQAAIDTMLVASDAMEDIIREAKIFLRRVELWYKEQGNPLP